MGGAVSLKNAADPNKPEVKNPFFSIASFEQNLLLQADLQHYSAYIAAELSLEHDSKAQ
jgi:hypothetical protein